VTAKLLAVVSASRVRRISVEMKNQITKLETRYGEYVVSCGSGSDELARDHVGHVCVIAAAVAVLSNTGI